VPLAESATLQMDYMQRVKVVSIFISQKKSILKPVKLQEVRIQQAEQRLARQKESRMAAGLSLPEESILKTKAAFLNYRDPQASFLIEGRQKASEANEVHDPTIQDKGTATSGIHYTVFE